MSHRQLVRVVCVSLTCGCMLGLPAKAAAQTASVPAEPREGLAQDTSWPEKAFNGLFESTIEDFRRLPSPDSLKWLGIGAAVAALGHSVDASVSRGLSTSSRLDTVFDSGETMGGARLQLGGALATYAIGRVTRSPKISRVGTDLVQAQIMSQALTGAVKMSVRRGRPDGTQYSFPSGHASVTFASATVLQRDLGWKAGIPAYGLATFVAASRIQERRHFLSDVAFGAAIGIMAGRTVTIGRGAGSFALAPVPASGGGAVSFTWVGRR